MKYVGSQSALTEEKRITTAQKLKIASVHRLQGNDDQMSYQSFDEISCSYKFQKMNINKSVTQVIAQMLWWRCPAPPYKCKETFYVSLPLL